MKSKWYYFVFYCKHTISNIIKNQSILTTLILSVFFYSFFYPIAYKSEHAQALPIVIVDEENSPLSNEIIIQASKSPNIEIKEITSNFLQAKQRVEMQQADGILFIPDNLSASIHRGETGGIGLYLSSAYFLRTKQIGLGLAQSIEQSMVTYTKKFSEISAFTPALSIHQLPLYNNLSGYGSYIFPAVAPLIIHQTILLGLCMLIAGYREKNWYCNPTEFFSIFVVLLCIGCLGCYYMFGFTFWLNDYPRGGNLWGMLITVPIFISSVISLAFFISSFLDSSERAGHVIVFSSIPLFMLSGAAWPHAAMPEWMQWFAWILPSTHGVQSFVQLNQMAASLSDITAKIVYMLGVSIFFGFWSYLRLSKAKIQFNE